MPGFANSDLGGDQVASVLMLRQVTFNLRRFAGSSVPLFDFRLPTALAAVRPSGGLDDNRCVLFPTLGKTRGLEPTFPSVCVGIAWDKAWDKLDPAPGTGAGGTWPTGAGGTWPTGAGGTWPSPAWLLPWGVLLPGLWSVEVRVWSARSVRQQERRGRNAIWTQV